MRVLILRPEPGNAATARMVARLGLQPVCIPLFEIISIQWSPPDPAAFGGIAMTSANAARYGGAAMEVYRHLPLFAVGEATAAAARDAGFRDVRTGTGNGARLATLWGTRAILHLTGLDHVPLGSNVTSLAVYNARRMRLTPEQTVQLVAPVALVHSLRAATAFASIVSARADTEVIALSAAVAAACGTGWRSILIADAPREQAMLETLARLCNTSDASMKGR